MVDLVICLAASAILLPLAVFTTGVFRIAFGLAFVLFIPGYSLVSALFPGKLQISGTERMALGFGLSIAVVPLIGFALNFTPAGITLYPVLISIFAFILLAGSIAWYRRSKLAPEERFTLPADFGRGSIRRLFSGRSKLDKILNSSLALAFLAAVITLGFVVSNPRSGERFSEFYILGEGGIADNYPTSLEVGQTASVTAGIVNHEQATATYRVEININGSSAGSYGPVTLEEGESWQQDLAFTPVSAGLSEKVEFELYLNGSSDVYLSTHIWIDVGVPATP